MFDCRYSFHTCQVVYTGAEGEASECSNTLFLQTVNQLMAVFCDENINVTVVNS